MYTCATCEEPQKRCKCLINKESNMNTDIEKAEKKTKVLIAYHAHCIDGFTSAWACWRGLRDMRRVAKEDIELLPVSYSDLTGILIAAESEEYAAIYFVDFSLPLENLSILTELVEVTIIDHHKSAFEKYVKEFLPLAVVPECIYSFEKEMDNLHIIFDLKECGASLTWKHFFSEEPSRGMPILIEYVKDYDLFQFKSQETKALNKALRLQEQTLSNWSMLAFSFEDGERREYYIQVGEAMLDYHNDIVSQLVFQAEPVTIGDAKGLVVNCSPQFASDVGHELALISCTFGATWQQEPKGVVKWSLRSNGDYDVSAIASIFGGGGHRNAAGFTISSPDYNHKTGITLWAE